MKKAKTKQTYKTAQKKTDDSEEGIVAENLVKELYNNSKTFNCLKTAGPVFIEIIHSPPPSVT